MKHKSLLVTITSVSFLGVGMTCQIAWAQTGQGAAHVPGRVLVKFNDGVSDGEARVLLAGKNALSTNVIPQIGVHVVQLPPNVDEQAFANTFKGSGDVEFVEVDHLRRPAAAVEPNDPLFGSQVLLPRIKAPDAWAVTTGNAGITIAVIDTGVDSTHPDLAANLVAGWNFLSNNSNTTDVGFHGTYMMGTVAAATNNNLGVAGVCWSCKLMALRVSDDSGSAADSTVASAILWARDHGVRIALVGYPVTGSATVSTAAQQFVAAGGVVIVPAGNDALALTTPDSPYMLTVGATNSLDQLQSWTNTGPMVDLVAPGSTYSTATGGGYANSWGSSFSAAFTAGVAALVKAANGSCTGQGIADVLKQTADDLGTPGRDDSFGWGRLNALRAVNLAPTCGGTATNTTTALTSSLNPSNLGQIVTFTATVSPSTATGTVTFLDGAATLGTGTLTGGTASLTTTSLVVGSRSITASYGGNSSFNPSTSPALMQTVNKASSTVSLASSPNPSTSGQIVLLIANLLPIAATGTVSFLDAGVQIGTGTVASGQATFSTSSLSTGLHSMTAVYSGDSAYNTSTAPAITQTVNAAAKTNTTTTVVSSLNPSILGNLVNFTATISPAAATGTVTFFDGAVNIGSGAVVAGVAILPLSSLSVGSHSITASYGGNSSYNASTSAALSQSVNKANTSTGIASSLNPSTFGQGVTFTATVSPAAATGTVNFRDGVNTVGTANVSGGTATFTTSSLTAGAHSMTAIYNGDGSYNTSTSAAVSQSVNKASSSAGLTSSLNPSTSGQAVTFTTTISPAAATGTVTFLDGAATLGTATLSGGTAAFVISSLTVSSHSITAQYGGDANYNTSTSPAVSQTVNTAPKTNTTTALSSSLNPSNGGMLVIFSASVAPAAATGTVTFFDGAATLGTASLSGGTATFATSSLVVGSHSITATYNGDSNYNTSTSTAVSQSVNKTNSTTGIASSLNPSAFGQAVTFTATVSPAEATGTVTFRDGANTIGTGTLSGGTATFTTSSLTAGSHAMTAIYNGDGNYNTSTSAAVSQSVNKAATSAVLISSANPSTFGQVVTFTASVSPSAATGTITLLDGAAPLGTATLSGGTATFALSSLAAGGHSITAQYGGDANYNGSTSPVVSQTVSAAAKTSSTTAVSSSLNPSNVGQIVTFTATVAPATATGTITFFDGGGLLGSATLSGGTAALSTSGLAVGGHIITASYNGDAATNGSISAGFSQTVNNISTTTSLTSNLNPSVSGQVVTFTAAVSPSAATGIVTFLDGGSAIGTGVLSGGIATLSTAGLIVGPHAITASYAGDSNYSGSTAAALTQTVSAPGDTIAPVSLFVTPTNGMSVAGNVTVTASATDNVRVTRMELYIGGSLKTTSSNGSLSYRWNARKLANTTQTLELRSYDAAGNMGGATAIVNVTK